MKNIMLFILIAFAVVPAHAQQEKSVESKITHVTVFLNKAQVTREVKTRIPEGATNVIISGLTAQLDAGSIQVSGKGNFILTGIAHQLNYLNDLATPARIRTLNDSLQVLQDKILFENAQKVILDKEELMLISNQKIGGANQNLPVNELKNMADFFRSRLYEIAVARLKHDEKIKSLNEKLSRIQQQIRTQNELSSRNTSEIVVNLSAKSATDAELTVNYIVGNARWHPLYDVRATNTKSPLTLFYKANVFQSTGENWNNARLKLSTANPSLGGVKPDLHTWHLDFYQRELYQKYRKPAGRQAGEAPSQALGEMVVAQESTTTADYVNVMQTALNTEFDISIPYTVNSTNKPTTVDIGRHELKSAFRYAVAPKLDPDAFLMAGTTGWEDYNLLPGEANVFFEGTFVGKTLIDPQSVKDTLYFSLGRDKRIVVKREKVKDFNAHAIIGLNQKESHGFEINLRNNQSGTITITVEDQIPVSKNSQIEVSLVDGGGAKFSPADGKLVWEITLKPNESRRLVYQFEVKYPKDKMIAGLN
ncbi:MAG: DUF4139 domain-containing protein [Cyclobacteriaceae bacterium]